MTHPTRFRFLGDHSEEHCGCEAVTGVIQRIVSERGIIVGPKDDFDALIVNGEGSMHHGRKNFLAKMHEIRLAQERGKETYLINTVWDSNPGGYDDCLTKLDGFWVRGVASSRDLLERHDLKVPHYIDLSYFADIDRNAQGIDFKQAIVATDVYAPQYGFVWLPKSKIKGWVNIDIRKHTWSSFVASLRTAKILITGRHHGMYAACRARIPFIPVAGNCHKFEDLLESAGVDIPIAKSTADMATLVKWASANRSEYDKLFKWMDKQPQWSFGEAAANAPLAAYEIPPRRTLLQRANDATTRRNYSEACALWQEMLAEYGEQLPYPRNACQAFFGNGEIEIGMEVLARSRAAKPHAIIFPKLLMQFARQQQIWNGRDERQGWWPLLKEAAYQAQWGQMTAFFGLAADAIAEVRAEHSPIMASSVSFFLACKLVSLNLHTYAFELRKRFVVDEAPEWAREQEEILLNALCRQFNGDALKLLEGAERQACWSDPAFRAIVVRYKALFTGPTDDLLQALHCHCEEFPKHAELRELLYSIAGEAGKLDFVKKLYPKDKAALERDAMSLLPLAHYLVVSGLSKSAKLQARSRLFESFQRGRDHLLAMLADGNGSIAVVGNSPVELGRGRGPLIDAHDIVIRFNDFVIDSPYDADYGAKTNVVFQTYAISKQSYAPVKGDDCLLVQRHAFNVFEPRDWEPVLQMAAAGQRFGYFPREAYILAARKLEATPSAGFAVANYMKHLRGALDRSDFFGFSFVDQLSGSQKAHYFSDERPSFIHDWQREAQEFEKLFQSHGDVNSPAA
ncbi:glycosyltransferase family 29 protein [Pararhizobium sp. BT-229]|uniref:glycosyltransferase family 29 protein n=1 Tax=Pararhizobium sp. BT-229 TaxID=2986923 RepID=UPI0021F6DBF2|nr:glycosyltransferase family 29 protein [Pararhizobium sp. BT-229]MCV9962231.1 glycosyltransferase family 29 protein [Pararhizobium sp. BT-229]